jgi:hypothetical protein
MTAAQYKDIYEGSRGIRKSNCGQFRFKICSNPQHHSSYYRYVAVFITDAKIHKAPESTAISYEETAEAAA